MHAGVLECAASLASVTLLRNGVMRNGLRGYLCEEKNVLFGYFAIQKKEYIHHRVHFPQRLCLHEEIPVIHA